MRLRIDTRFGRHSTGKKGRTRRETDGMGRIEFHEAGSLAGNPVHSGGVNVRAAQMPDGIAVLLIGNDEKNIRPGVFSDSGSASI